MIVRIVLCFTLGFCLSHPISAQFLNPESIPQSSFQQAIELYELKQYGAAKNLFGQLKNDQNLSEVLRHNAQYYEALSALYLQHNDGEKLIKNFVNDHPNHPQASSAYFVLADYYFAESNYRKAIEYFEMADLSRQSKNRQIEGNYKLAYSLFARRAFDESLNYFNKIKNGKHAYAAAANYYGGFILYDQGKNDQALQYFKTAEQSENYKEVVPYLIASIYYRKTAYDQLVSYAMEVLEYENLRNRNEIYLLLGESYFMKEDFDQAATYFTEYMEMGGLASDPKLIFRIAYTQYIAYKYDDAKMAFQQMSGGKDSLSQAAAYYLGNIHLKENDLNAAANAYQLVVKNGPDTEIRQEAAFKLGQIYFQNGNFSQAIEVMETFQTKYPQSKHITASREIISEAYLRTSDYDRAIAYIEKLPNKSKKVRAAYQEVTFLKGASLFNNGNFYAAFQSFEKSIQFPEKEEILAETYYWMGEALSSGKQYEQAIEVYKKAFSISGIKKEIKTNLDYGLGYAYFNNQSYKDALASFQRFVDQVDRKAKQDYYEDALLRLADSYYANKQYKLALSTYQRAINEKVAELDYAYFQKAVMHSILLENKEAIQVLDQLITRFPKSRYVEDAIYQKALIYYESGNYDQSLALFTQLINERKQSSLLPYAYAKRAISHYNKGDLQLTAQDYKYILDHYITHPVASEALLGLQQVLVALDQSSDMDRYIEAYKKANPEGEEIATVEFESAKSLYFEQNYDKAINSLQNYINQYEGNTYSYDAKYYLADALQRKGKLEESLVYFEQVIEDNRSSFVNRSYQRFGDINYELSRYEQAIPYYKQLSFLASNKRELYNGWSGMMESYFMLAQYDSLDFYAKQILEQANVNANAENHAHLFLGKSAMQQGKYDQARTYFNNCIKSAKDKYAVEAKYLLAQMSFVQKDYKNSLEILFELNKDFAMYPDWVGKSFLLIAENYLALNELFQAKATLQSIIDRSENAQIKKQAQVKLDELIMKEEQNRSEQQRKQDSINKDMILLQEIDSLANTNDEIDEN